LRLKDIIRAPKTEIVIGGWHAGRVERKDFPIAKKAYRLGSSFQWCVITFQALGAECRVLVVRNDGKQKYEAVLGVMGANGMLRILCTYEYHASEPGWHCHATHDDVSTLSAGTMRGPWIRRIPGPRKPHRCGKYSKFTMSDAKQAIRFAVDRYKIAEKGPLL
jgi:hypothetical protein